MTLARSLPGLHKTALTRGWALALSAPDAWADPATADRAAQWRPALVPGTAAQSLEQFGLWSRMSPTPLHDQDVWYRTSLDETGPATLRFDGLATVAEVWLDDVLLARSQSMFELLEIPVELTGENNLFLVFRSLTGTLAGLKGPRARWRTRMVEDAKLRFVRTTILGNAPGWCPPFHVVGPYRPVSLLQHEPDALHVGDIRLRTRLDGDAGVLDLRIAIAGLAPDDVPVLHCGEAAMTLTDAGDGIWTGSLFIENVELWWPHTHGASALYPVSIATSRGPIDLGRTGFRTITIDHGPDGSGFTLVVNGVRIFCRGACWTPTDLVSLDSMRETYRAALTQVTEFNANMVRVGGTTVYETDAFFEVCDELGLLVWQDCMFANFDYPTDPAFLDTVRREVKLLLERTQASPCLAVLCGGSEVLQQAAMMGLPERMRGHPISDVILPTLVDEHRPDLAYVPGSPSGGTLPFVADAGPSHYYGVGAYNLPLEDARRAGVRFASECLTFANMPDDATLRATGLDPSTDLAAWAARVPRDNGASWDFEDTRHHYMTRLYGVDCAALRSSDPQRYRDLSRAVQAEVTERTFDEWRRPGSTTTGGLVWFWKDFCAGPGWGVVDSSGRPKSNAFAMKRAFAPLRLSLTDEGVNGLMIHAVNDTAMPVEGEIVLTCLRHGAMRVMEGRGSLNIVARGGASVAAFTLFGAFFDAGHVYRFGPAAHDTVHAVLERDGQVLTEAVWLLDAARADRHAEAPIVTLERDDLGWRLTLETARALHGVSIDDDAFIPDDNWFSLMPGRAKMVRLSAAVSSSVGPVPKGTVRALNVRGATGYG